MRWSEHRTPLSKIERDRLYPGLSNPSFLVLRSRRMIFDNWINRLAGDALKILDIGGRYQPYRRLFGDRVARYIACDILSSDLVDVMASGECLPFAADTFDVVISTQVFEYFQNPAKAGAEVYRVLKPGGVLLMSVASLAPRFVDEECWRFNKGGIRATLSSFSSIEIIPETTSPAGLIRLMNLGLHSFTRYAPVRKLYEFTICPCLNLIGLAVESAKLTSNDQFAANYSVLARK